MKKLFLFLFILFLVSPVFALSFEDVVFNPINWIALIVALVCFAVTYPATFIFYKDNDMINIVSALAVSIGIGFAAFLPEVSVFINDFISIFPWLVPIIAVLVLLIFAFSRDNTIIKVISVIFSIILIVAYLLYTNILSFEASATPGPDLSIFGIIFSVVFIVFLIVMMFLGGRSAVSSLNKRRKKTKDKDVEVKSSEKISIRQRLFGKRKNKKEIEKSEEDETSKLLSVKNLDKKFLEKLSIKYFDLSEDFEKELETKFLSISNRNSFKSDFKKVLNKYKNISWRDNNFFDYFLKFGLQNQDSKILEFYDNLLKVYKKYNEHIFYEFLTFEFFLKLKESNEKDFKDVNKELNKLIKVLDKYDNKFQLELFDERLKVRTESFYNFINHFIYKNNEYLKDIDEILLIQWASVDAFENLEFNYKDFTSFKEFLKELVSKLIENDKIMPRDYEDKKIVDFFNLKFDTNYNIWDKIKFRSLQRRDLNYNYIKLVAEKSNLIKGLLKELQESSKLFLNSLEIFSGISFGNFLNNFTIREERLDENITILIGRKNVDFRLASGFVLKYDFIKEISEIKEKDFDSFLKKNIRQFIIFYKFMNYYAKENKLDIVLFKIFFKNLNNFLKLTNLTAYGIEVSESYNLFNVENKFIRSHFKVFKEYMLDYINSSLESNSDLNDVIEFISNFINEFLFIMYKNFNFVKFEDFKSYTQLKQKIIDSEEVILIE